MGNYSKNKICWVCGGRIKNSVANKLNSPVAELGLSNRALNCLRIGNIRTVRQLIRLSKDELLRMRKLGKVSLNEIIEKIQAFGFDVHH